MYEDSLFSTPANTCYLLSSLIDFISFFIFSPLHEDATSRFYTQYPNVLLVVILRGRQRAMVEGEPCLWKVERREREGGGRVEVSRPSWSPDRVLLSQPQLTCVFPCSVPRPSLDLPCASRGPIPCAPSQAITEHLREKTPDGPTAVCGSLLKSVLIRVRQLNVGEKALFKELQPA